MNLRYTIFLYAHVAFIYTTPISSFALIGFHFFSTFRLGQTKLPQKLHIFNIKNHEAI